MPKVLAFGNKNEKKMLFHFVLCSLNRTFPLQKMKFLYLKWLTIPKFYLILHKISIS